MANIYLHLPQPICAYYRNRDRKNVLLPHQPVKFSVLGPAMAYIYHGSKLCAARPPQVSCFTQREWRNICEGRPAAGGKVVIPRNPQEYPTTAEVYQVERDRYSQKIEGYDYLCIALPREVCVDGTIHRTNSDWGLESSAASQLAAWLRTQFKMTLLDFYIHNTDFCNQNNLDRDRIEIIERFCFIYDIRVTASQKERETIRRQLNRYIDEALLYHHQRLNTDFDVVTRIDEGEAKPVRQ